MFARKQKLCAAIPMDPPSPSQCLQEPLMKKYNEKYTKVHQHERAEEDQSFVVVGAPVMVTIQSCSFLLGLMIALFLELSIFSAHFLTLAMFGDDADPDVVKMFSTMLSSCFTSVIITLGFLHALDRYLLSCDPSEENKTIIIRHIVCRVGLGTLVGVSSGLVLIDLCYIILFGLDVHIIKYSAAMLVGVMMLSLISHFCSGNNKHRQVTVTLLGSLVETNKVAPIASSTNNKHGIIDPAEIRWGEVNSDTLSIV
jgi:hypothetical protein